MCHIHKPPPPFLRVIWTTETRAVLLLCLSWPPHIASRGVVGRRWLATVLAICSLTSDRVNASTGSAISAVYLSSWRDVRTPEPPFKSGTVFTTVTLIKWPLGTPAWCCYGLTFKSLKMLQGQCWRKKTPFNLASWASQAPVLKWGCAQTWLNICKFALCSTFTNPTYLVDTFSDMWRSMWQA